MTDERIKGRFQKGHTGTNKPANPEPPAPDPPGDGEFDQAILAAAANFGTQRKPKTGLAGYAASLRDTRPQDFALLLTKASARRAQAYDNAAAYAPLKVEVVPCPPNFFMPSDEAFALWAARAGHTPVLVIDNADTQLIEDEGPDDDNA